MVHKVMLERELPLWTTELICTGVRLRNHAECPLEVIHQCLCQDAVFMHRH